MEEATVYVERMMEVASAVGYVESCLKSAVYELERAESGEDRPAVALDVERLGSEVRDALDRLQHLDMCVE